MASKAPFSFTSPKAGATTPTKVKIIEKPTHIGGVPGTDEPLKPPLSVSQATQPMDTLRLALVKVIYGFYLVLKSLFVSYQLIKTLIRYLFILVTPPWRKSVEGKVILITGAGHGVGRQLAVMFARRGATLVLWDDNFKGNLDTRYMVELVPAKCHTYTFDLTDEMQVGRQRMPNAVINYVFTVPND